MSSVVEKLAAIEREVAAIQPKMAPLTERIDDLDQKVAGFARQLSGIAEESAAVKQDIELTRQSLVRIQTLIGESKAESEQLVAGQEENQQRCETMTAVFGAAFQAMSQFFETAQRMGIADQAKAVFLSPPSAPVESALPPLPIVPALPESVPPETQEADESTLSESDFESTISGADAQEFDSYSIPGLPDVAAPPEIVHDDFDSAGSDSEPNTEPSDEMASHLDVPPLNLAVPALPEQSESATAVESDEQEIEDLLASMMTPVTAGS